jgi:hypothetical protein
MVVVSSVEECRMSYLDTRYVLATALYSVGENRPACSFPPNDYFPP